MKNDQQIQNTINVKVKSAFLSGQSNPATDHYVFMYTVTIHNAGAQPAKLVSRHWIIIDAHGNVQEVQGVGVVGEQPYLKPGESYEYSSGAILSTPVGSMHGTYQMLTDDGEQFDAIIPPFSLATPNILH